MVVSVLATEMVESMKAGAMGVELEKGRDPYWDKG